MGRRSTGTIEPLKTAIRLKFTVYGQRRVETLDLPPTPANLKAAARVMANVQAAIQAGYYRREDHFSADRASSRQTFKEYADEWLKTKVIAKSTRDSYEVALSATWNPAFADKALGEIRYSDIRKVIAERDKVASGKTINNHMIALRGIFKTAVLDGLVAANPTEGIGNLKHQSPAADPFDADDREAILARMKAKFDLQVFNYFTMAFHTGLRPSEQIALGWPDIDWKRRKARISKARVVGEDKGTKTNTVREVDLNDRVMAALESQKTFTFMKRPEGPIFENPETGKPWHDLQVQRKRYFTPTLIALKIRHRDMYQTRHTFATLALMAGIIPTYISKQLGHNDLGMLFKVYGTWIEGADGGAEAEKANRLLGQLATKSPRKDTGS